MTPFEISVLHAVINRIVPADEDPAGSGFGADHYVSSRLVDPSALIGRDRQLSILSGLSSLEEQARMSVDGGFLKLSLEQQDSLLKAQESLTWFQALTELVAEGVYADPGNGGNLAELGWRMVGYEHGMPEGPNGPAPGQIPPPRTLPGARTGADYDVIVVGAGTAGGIAACMLAEAGKRVLLIERGGEHSYASDGRRDHLRNHRYSKYGHNTGPPLSGNPRVFVDVNGVERIVAPNQPEYSNVATGVGGAGLVYGGLAFRFLPDDFKMASRYGISEGSSLVDWPLELADLVPSYEQAEWEIGVSGGSRAGSAPERGYPMPAFPAGAVAEKLGAGADRLGISTFPPPMLINSTPRGGRGCCIACGSCVGFACPSDAKNGVHNTMAPRALATGRCDLLTGAVVERIDQDDRGKVIGVSYMQADEAGALHRRSVRSLAVTVSCGAIETARLLQMSRSAIHSAGLGNKYDLVGRNLQGHYYPTAFGLFDEEVIDGRGPGVSIATTNYNHGNRGVVGGAMLSDDFITPPIMFWDQALPPDLPRWGRPAKAFMRENYRRVAQVKGPVHETPSPESRVTLHGTVRDRYDLPVARLSGATHYETVRTADFILDKARAWLEASGAVRTWGARSVRRLSASHHQAGTCRMGLDPRSSVTDSFGRVWGHDNLFVCDASLHPTNGGFNPVLTIMALAFRNSAHIQASL